MDLASRKCGSKGEVTVSEGSGRETLPSCKTVHW